jgi:hypothetical protein
MKESNSAPKKCPSVKVQLALYQAFQMFHVPVVSLTLINGEFLARMIIAA